MSLEKLQATLIEIGLGLIERDRKKAEQDAQALLKLKAQEAEQGFPATALQFMDALKDDREAA